MASDKRTTGKTIRVSIDYRSNLLPYTSVPTMALWVTQRSYSALMRKQLEF